MNIHQRRQRQDMPNNRSSPAVWCSFSHPSPPITPWLGACQQTCTYVTTIRGGPRERNRATHRSDRQDLACLNMFSWGAGKPSSANRGGKGWWWWWRLFVVTWEGTGARRQKDQESFGNMEFWYGWARGSKSWLWDREEPLTGCRKATTSGLLAARKLKTEVTMTQRVLPTHAWWTFFYEIEEVWKKCEVESSMFPQSTTKS
jgi:hypothetical protein